MKLYKLPIVLYEPSEDTNDMYMAEVPVLPGCRAWGETASQALEYVKGMAEAFIESYLEDGDPLPEAVEALALKSVGPVVHAAVTVSA
jgi:predicted RNase H-like HicB family nuclease